MAKLSSGTRIYGTANVDNLLFVGGVTSANATNTTSGSLQVTGGVGITGNLYVGTAYLGTAYSPTDIYEVDDISYLSDGFTNTFPLRYNGSQVTIPSPYNLMVVVNGLTQPAFDYKYDTVWLSSVLTASKGYCIDNIGNPTTNNYIKFADSLPLNSQVLIRTVAGGIPATRKTYPFKPVDILMGY
jgi:hypothetical protein